MIGRKGLWATLATATETYEGFRITVFYRVRIRSVEISLGLWRKPILYGLPRLFLNWRAPRSFREADWRGTTNVLCVVGVVPTDMFVT